MDDDTLLDAWRTARDEGAFRTLCERHAGLLRSAAVRAGAGDPDEVAQAACILLAREPGRVPRGRLAGWLMLVARNLAANQRRREETRRRHEQEAAMAAQQPSTPPDEDLRPLLDEALARLSPARREAVIRFHLAGRQQEQIAAELGCSVGAVKMRIHEGLEQMRAFLARRGATVGTAAIAAALAAPPMAAGAESALAAVCSQAALHPAGAPAGAAALSTSALSGASLGTIIMASSISLILVSGLVAAGVALSSSEAPPTPAPLVVPAAEADFTPLLDQPISVAWRHATLQQAMQAVDARTWLQVDGLPTPKRPVAASATPDPGPLPADALREGSFERRPLHAVLDALAGSELAWSLVGDRIILHWRSPWAATDNAPLIAWIDALPDSTRSSSDNMPIVTVDGQPGSARIEPQYVSASEQPAADPALTAAIDRAATRLSPERPGRRALLVFAKARHPWARTSAWAVIEKGDRLDRMAAIEALAWCGQPKDAGRLFALCHSLVTEALSQTGDEAARTISWARAAGFSLTTVLRRTAGDAAWRAGVVAQLVAEIDRPVPDHLRKTSYFLARQANLAVLGWPEADALLVTRLNSQQQIDQYLLERWRWFSPAAATTWTLGALADTRRSAQERSILLSHLANFRDPRIAPVLIRELAGQQPLDLNSPAVRGLVLQDDPASIQAIEQASLSQAVIDALRIVTRDPALETVLIAAAAAGQNNRMDAVFAAVGAESPVHRRAVLLNLLQSYQTPATTTAAKSLRQIGDASPGTQTPAGRREPGGDRTESF
jgi:RNA polymerase sigma factor (sigma-70 family)